MEKEEKHLIEGIDSNGDGGQSFSGNFNNKEIVEKINYLLQRYRKRFKKSE